MNWIDIASIVFVCVTMNHLGLVKAVEDIYECELRVINCPKCFTCWSVLAYTIFASREIITSLAVSFLSSYLAIWLELLEGYVDTIYLRFYDKIYTTSDDTPAADPKHGHPAGSVS